MTTTLIQRGCRNRRPSSGHWGRASSHWGRFAAAFLVSVAIPVAVSAQQDQGDDPIRTDSESAATDGSASVRVPRLPTALPDGRPVRAIGFYQSQVAELVPKHYQPVQIDQLRSAVNRLANLATDDQSTRLKGSVYWINVEGDTLMSERSVIDFESDRQGIVRRSLGRMKLAIAPPASPLATSPRELLPRLETEPSGNVVAVFDGDDPVSRLIEFRWRLRGTVSGSGHEFNLRLPPTPQTRIVLSAPSDVSVDAIDGVLRRRTSPPPDAMEFVEDRNWYEIDAGGLETVRIRTQKLDPENENASFVVRQSSIQYRVEPGGLAWTCRMFVQPPVDRPLPKLVVRGTTITTARINGTDVAYSSETIGDRQQYLQLDVPRGLIDDQSLMASVTLSGYSHWNGRRGWCDLPMPIFSGSNVVHASTKDDVELVVSDPLQVATWELPPTWNESIQNSSDGVSSFYQATGPPVALSAVGDSGEVTSQPTWSRVRLHQRAFVARGETALRLELADSGLLATALIEMEIDTDRVEPLRLQVEPGWSVDSVTFVHSGRLIESPGVDDASRFIDLWPEQEDVNGSALLIEVSGTRLLPSASNVSIPSTWFVRIEGMRGDLIAAILRPADLNWSGESTMQRLPDPPLDMSESQTELFSGVDDQTLWFRPIAGRSPEVHLQTPTVAFSAKTLLQLFRDPDDLLETIVVEVESQSQALKQLTVDAGATSGRPPLRWSISGINGSPTTSISPSDIEVGQAERDGIYVIDVSDKILRGRRLIGRRRYPIDRNLTLSLPAVPGAASQQSEVHVGPGLVIARKSRAVQRVPFGKTALERFEVDSPLSAGIQDPSQVSRLRYDAVEQPSLTLAPSSVPPDVTIVWREQIRVIASSRGTDLIEATYHVSPAADFQIDYEPDLQLTSITRDGVPVDLNSVSQRPIVLTSQRRRETIRVRWTRSLYESSWLRQCRMPLVEASGTVLRSESQLIAATDTFAPAALWQGRSVGSRFSTVTLGPGKTATLVRRNIALALGWLASLLLFAISWSIAERSPTIIAVVTAVLTTVLALWWPWRLAIIGWWIVPVLAAAMVATCKRWGTQVRTRVPRSEGSTASQKSLTDITTDFSLGHMAKFMVWMLVFAFGSMIVIGQDSPVVRQPIQTKPHQNPVRVLVPMTADGKVYGDMVYIPKNVKDELFPAASTRPIQESRIEWASYRLRLHSDSVGNNPDAAVTLEAEYLMHVDPSEQTKTSVRLPLPPAAVRGIERVDEMGGPIPYRITPQGDVVATFPRGEVFRIRVTLRPASSQSDQWTKLFVPVPPVAATRLTVESEQDIDAIRLGGTKGGLLRESDLRRWVEDLGPVDSLEIDFRPETSSLNDTAPLQRRYWVTASAQQVSIDCELDPPKTLAAGESFQFVIRDSRLPTVTSPDWRLERSEQYTPTRRLMTFTSLRDGPGPVRLLWTEPIEFVDADSSATVRIPEVIAAALGDNAPAWIAIHCEPGLRFVPLQRDTTESLSVDHFLAAWTGYRGNIDRAFIALAELPSPQLERDSSSVPEVRQRQDIRVSQQRMEVHYTATIIPTGETNQRHTIRYPRSLQIVRVTVNGQSVASTPIRLGKDSGLPLGIMRGTDPIQVELVGVESFAGNTRREFSPPQIQLLPASISECTCTLYRDSSIRLRITEPPEAETTDSDLQLTPEMLAQGWMPVASWTRPAAISEPSEDPPSHGLFTSRTVNPRFDCSQLISLNRTDGQWEMEAMVSFLPNQIPDYVDVEVPTVWCDDLKVDPSSLVYVQRPSTDDSRQILRIQCDPTQLDSASLSLIGRLQTSETGRVNVPSVRVLGTGSRRVYVDVPTRIEEEPIQWRTSAVEAIDLPDNWATPEANRSTYLVASPNWSIDLAPLPEDDAGAIAVNADAQVFLREDGALMVCHWDVYPGNLESVRVRLPRGAQCVGAWSAGRAVVPTTTATADETDASFLDIPLAITGLSQPIEILVQLPPSSARQTGYLPELVGVTVTRNWLVHYVPDRGTSSVLPSLDQQRQERNLAMAQGVVEAVAAVSRVTQRPRDEVAAWLAMWVGRYRTIAQSVGRNPDLVEIGALLGESDELTPERFAIRQSLPIHLQWKELDAELARHLNRLLPPETQSATESSSDTASILRASGSGSMLFAVDDFEGFVPQQIMAISAANRPRPIQAISESDIGLRTLIVNLLTLCFVAGLLMCLRPLKGVFAPIFAHPAFWLALTGLFSFAVAPVAVAGALLLVAVTLPVFPSNR